MKYFVLFTALALASCGLFKNDALTHEFQRPTVTIEVRKDSTMVAVQFVTRGAINDFKACDQPHQKVEHLSEIAFHCPGPRIHLALYNADGDSLPIDAIVDTSFYSKNQDYYSTGILTLPQGLPQASCLLEDLINGEPSSYIDINTSQTTWETGLIGREALLIACLSWLSDSPPAGYSMVFRQYLTP